MKTAAASVLMLAGLALSPVPALAQPDPPPAAPLLGRAHLVVKTARVDFDREAGRAWGIDRERYLGVEAYWALDRAVYVGGAIGHAGTALAVAADGDVIRDLDFLWLEASQKAVVGLRHGFTFGAGLGAALFYVEGREVVAPDDPETTDPIADVGFGAQAFVDLTWRAKRFLAGVEVQYQWAFDLLEVDYSNLRAGARLGVTF
jgi:hypothetical protein